MSCCIARALSPTPTCIVSAIVVWNSGLFRYPGQRLCLHVFHQLYYHYTRRFLPPLPAIASDCQLDFTSSRTALRAHGHGSVFYMLRALVKHHVTS